MREKAYQTQFQITRITRERNAIKHDDRVDALAGMVQQFNPVLDQDATLQREILEEEIEDEDEEFDDADEELLWVTL